jgi:hypothetical protein
MSRVQRLDECRKTIDGAGTVARAGALDQAIIDALDVPPPTAAPATLDGYADVLARAAHTLEGESATAHSYASVALPQMWLGMTASGGTQAMTAVSGELERIAVTLRRAGDALASYAEKMRDVGRRYDRGTLTLSYARPPLAELGRSSPADEALTRQVQHQAQAGIADMLAAAHEAEDAGRLAAKVLDELSAAAHAARLTTTALTDLDKLVLVDAAVPALDPALHDDNLILTADAATRASGRLNQLDPVERGRFDTLLSRAQSAEERAYLVQALASGRSLAEIERFAGMIHPHGGDPEWLRTHLTPASTHLGPAFANLHSDVNFNGAAWTQGVRPTCVAGSAILARARVDPVYALDLTTGGHPGDPAFDNGSAFAQRLADEQERVYHEGRPPGADAAGWPVGIGDTGKDDVVNDELGGPTGRQYELLDINSAEGRRDALPTIEHNVDLGVPISFGVNNVGAGGYAHEMVVVGHDGDMLQIYNPWGYTVWVDENTFINGHLDSFEATLPPGADDVTLPRR